VGSESGVGWEDFNGIGAPVLASRDGAVLVCNAHQGVLVLRFPDRFLGDHSGNSVGECCGSVGVEGVAGGGVEGSLRRAGEASGPEPEP